MELRNIIVGLNIGHVSSELVAFACHLARSNHATVTGFTAAQPAIVAFAMDGASAAAVVYSEQRSEIERALADAEAQFRNAVPAGVKHAWIGCEADPSAALIGLARQADLIILDSGQAGGLDRSRDIDQGEVLLRSGRPVLIAAHGASRLKADTVVIAWKDTREARRAVVDAMPFLKAADRVKVIVVNEGDLAAERSSMLDLVHWLQTHDVKADGDVLPLQENLGQTIGAAAVELHSDLVVSGAYGHSRFREWLLGGATRDLLTVSTFSRLMSS